MDIENDLNRALKSQADTPTQMEAGCTKMVQRLLELGPPETEIRQLGPYRLIERIGEGGMGEVWRAHHEKLDRIVAVKRLKPQVIQSDELKQRFEREMRIAGNLHHPNIVQITHADEVDGVHYLAMEFVNGQTLSEVLQTTTESGQQLSVAAVCRYGRQIAAGLQYAHENDIVHRDIKPANVMVTEDGDVKILDMGLARFAHRETPVSELTAEHQTMGTLDYMPPEQLRDTRSAGIPADIYSLGCTLYKLLTGRAPFADDRTSTAEAKIMAIAGEVPESVVELRPDVPESLSSLIDQMLLKEPDQRPESMAAILARPELDVEDDAAIVQPRTAAKGGDIGGPRSRTKWIAGGLFGLFVLICGVVLQLSDPVHGNLTIEAPDGVTIRATKVDDPSEAYEFTTGKDAAVLKVGTWKITVVGDGFNQFIVDGSDVVKIAGPDGAVVKLTRSRPESEKLDADSAIAAKERMEKPLAETDLPNGSADRPTDDELLARLDGVDWKSGQAHQLMVGEVSNPAQIEGLPNWQLGSKFPVGGRLVGVSPQGTYLLVAVPGGSEYYIYRRSNGRLHGVIEVEPKHSSTHTWNPNEEELVILSGNPPTCRVFTANGRFLRRFPPNDGTRYWSGKSLHWSPDGQRILVAATDAVEMLTPEGERIESFVPPETGGDFPDGQVWSPDGSMFALRNEKQLRVYKSDGGDPIYEATLCFSADTGFSWHPSSKAIIHLQEKRESPMVVWSLDDELRINTELTLRNVICFSPDGRFFIDHTGRIYDTLTGAKVSQINVPIPDAWANNIVRWEERSKITLFVRSKPGAYIESAPSGKLIRDVAPPQPLPILSGNWLKAENKAVSVFPSPYEFQYGKQWMFDWNERGEGQARELDSARELNTNTSPMIGWNAAESLFSVADVNGVHTFDLDGKRVSHVEQGKNCKQAIWSPNGKRLAVCYHYNGGVVVYDDGKPRKYLENEEARPGLHWAADSNRLLVSFGRTGHYSPETGQRHALISVEEGKVEELITRCVNPFSPSGKWTTVATETGITLEADGEEPRILNFGQPIASVRWSCHWNTDETQVFLFGADPHELWLYDLESGALASRGRVHFNADTLWCGDSLLMVGSNSSSSSLSLRSGSEPPSPSIDLPTRYNFMNFATGRRTAFSLGDGVPLSADGRYVSVILNTGAHFDHGGNLCVVDLEERQVAWTGIAFSDGNRAVIESSGRVREFDDGRFEDYLTYTVSYPAWDPQATGNRIVPLTQLQFASRIGLSKSQQAMQTILDLGGTLFVGDAKQPVTAFDITDTRDLPAPAGLIGLELTHVPCVSHEVMSQLKHLNELQHVSLHLWRLGVEKMEFISTLEKLRVLDLSGNKLSQRISGLFPESIEELDLSRTDVGDFFLLELERLKSLKKLDLSHTQVTPRAVAQLQSKLPDCVITCEYPEEFPAPTGNTQTRPTD